MIDDLMALILPWAKQHRPEEYAQTLAVNAIPRTFERYLIRLVELRVAAEPGWIREVPLWVLEETRLTVRCRHRPTGTAITVAGRRVEHRQYGFGTLRLTPAELAQRMQLVDALDLELLSEGPHA